MLKFHCNACGDHAEFHAVDLTGGELGNVPWKELKCNCGDIVAILSSDVPGMYDFRPSLPELTDKPGTK